MKPIRTILDKLAPISLKIQGLRFYRMAGRKLRPAIVIRTASSEEACHILASFFQNTGNYLPGPQVTPFIAYHGTRPVGYAELIRHDPSQGDFSGDWLFSLYVRYRYRGLGIGEQLCESVIEKAIAEGEEKLSLLVAVENQTAQSLYRKLGFNVITDDRELQRLNFIYDPAFPLLVMQKQLK